MKGLWPEGNNEGRVKEWLKQKAMMDMGPTIATEAGGQQRRMDERVGLS